jgi:16S rRNA (cytosine967-C5)-methyltransferase
MVSPFGLVSEKGNLSKTSLFERGLLTMQDESSMLVAPTLKIEPHHQVLDACAAPGGKTTHIALFLDSEKGGKVTALDIYEHKIKLIDENVARLKMEDRVETVLGDATEVHQTFPRESFDRILVDAPCSGLGLMRRKPDIKYTKEYQDFSGLQKIQLDILESVSTCLKKNGIITYSTCTILEEENQVVVNKFLSKHPEFVLEEVFVPKSVQKLVKDGVVQILPHHFSTDGFFISCLRKQK